MATINLNRVQFWQPPLNPSFHKQRIASPHKQSRPASATSSRNQPASLHNKADPVSKRTGEPKSTVTATRHRQHDLTAQPEDEGVRAQGTTGRNHDLTNRGDEADDLPSIEEVLGPLLRKELAAEGCQNSEDTLDTSGNRLGQTQSRLDDNVGDSQCTRDKPVILENDEPDNPDPEADFEVASVSASVNAGAVPAFELSKLIDPSDHEAWYDVEDDCYVDEDLRPLPPLQQEGLASMLTQEQPHSRHPSPRLTQDQINPRDNDGTTQSVSEEPAPYSPPTLLSEDGGEGRDENASELEKDMLLAFEEQEKSSAASSPSSPRPPHCSTELSHPQVDREHDQGGASHGRLEELGYGSSLCNQDQGEKKPQEHQQEQEAAVDAMRQEVEVKHDDGDNDDGERKQHGEKQRYQDKVEEISSDIPHLESSNDGHNTNGEDDEDPQPAKRRKLAPISTEDPTPRLSRPHSLTLSSTTQPEMDEARSEADYWHLPTPVDGEHHTPRTSRSPSATVESAPVAEYQEWPFQGFLKRTRIGNETTYNLEFQLPHIPGHLHHPIPSEALGIGSNKATSAEASTPHNAVTHSKVRPAALRLQKKRAPWTPEEDATLLKMKEDGCSWEDIHAALPHRTKGTIQVHYSTKLKK